MYKIYLDLLSLISINQIKCVSFSMSKFTKYCVVACENSKARCSMYFSDNFLFSLTGEKSRDPSEACMDYYFDEKKSPLITWVQPNGHNRRPCQFHGRYALYGNIDSLSDILLTNSFEERQNRKFDLHNTVLDQKLMKTPPKPKCTISESRTGSTQRFSTQNSLYSATMYAGCSQSSSDITIESTCDYGVNYNGISEQRTLNDKDLKFKIKNEFACHGAWEVPISETAQKNQFEERTWGSKHHINSDMTSLRRSSNRRQYGGQDARAQQLTGYNHNRPQKLKKDIIVLSTNSYDSYQHGQQESSVGKSQKFTCLSYTEMDDGTLFAKVGQDACIDYVEPYSNVDNDVIQWDSDQRSRLTYFNISSSGPCLQALTGSASSFHSTSQIYCAIVMSYLIVLTFASASHLSKLF